MTDHEQETFERQLRRTPPARLPEDFAVRLRAAELTPEADGMPESSALLSADYWRILWRSLRWLIPATATAAAVMLAWHESQPFGSRPAISAPASQAGIVAAPLSLRADEVKIDQRLVSSFDAVARLPSGEPVRFRCEHWMDEFVLSDHARGVVVENRKPRVEVLPVGYETY